MFFKMNQSKNFHLKTFKLVT